MEHLDRPAPIDPVLTLSQVRAAVSYSSSQLYRMVKAGSFPKQIRLGPGRVGWRQSTVAAWLKAREATEVPSEP